MNEKEQNITLLAQLLFIIGLVVIIYTCQPPKDILQDAEFPCEIIRKGYNHAIHIQCQDSLYKFRSENYYTAFKEGEIITEQLNK